MIVHARQFDLEALQTLATASSDPHLSITAFESELEKIAFLGAVIRGAGGAASMLGRLGSGALRGVSGLGSGATRGASALVDATSGLGAAARSGASDYVGSLGKQWRAGRAGRTFNQQIAAERLGNMGAPMAATGRGPLATSRIDEVTLQRRLAAGDAPSQVPATALSPDVPPVETTTSTPVLTTAASTPRRAAVRRGRIPNQAGPAVNPAAVTPAALPNRANEQTALVPVNRSPAAGNPAAANSSTDAAAGEWPDMNALATNAKNWYAGLTNAQKAALMAGTAGAAGLGGLAAGAVVD